MMHIIIGLFFIALGIWGVFDEWYYVVDFIKGSGSVVLILAGLLALFAGAVGPIGRPEELETEASDIDDDDVDDHDDADEGVDDETEGEDTSE